MFANQLIWGVWNVLWAQFPMARERRTPGLAAQAQGIWNQTA